MKANRNLTSLDYGACAACAFAVLIGFAAIISQKSYFASTVAPGLFVLFGSLAVFFGTTSGVKKRAFDADFYDCSRERSPLSFWVSAAFGYCFFALLFTFSAYLLFRG